MTMMISSSAIDINTIPPIRAPLTSDSSDAAIKTAITAIQCMY